MIKKLIVVPLCMALLVCFSFVHQGTATSSKTTHPYQVANFLPSDQEFVNDWLTSQIEGAGAADQTIWPVIIEFKKLIETDPRLYMLFNQMFEQIPRKPTFNMDPTGKPQIKIGRAHV